MTIQLAVSAAKPMTDFVFGVAIFNADGVCCYGTNTWVEELAARSSRATAKCGSSIENLDLIEGTYKIDVAAHSRDGYPYDYHRLLYTFRVKSRTKDVGIFRPRHRWEFSPSVQVGADAEVMRSRVLSLAEAVAFVARLHATVGRSSSPTASSTCSIRATFAICVMLARVGDALIVGVNSDRSVRANKGPDVRSMPKQERAELLAALACRRRGRDLRRRHAARDHHALQPDMLVKGADWAADRIVGRDVVEARGGRVVRATIEPGHSTTTSSRRFGGVGPTFRPAKSALRYSRSLRSCRPPRPSRFRPCSNRPPAAPGSATTAARSPA